MRAELASKQDRVNQLRQEIAENERQLDMAQVGEYGTKNPADLYNFDFRRILRKYRESSRKNLNLLM